MTSRGRPFLPVLRKELTDAIRDRRSVTSALFFPVLGPLMIAFMFNALVERERETKAVDLPVVGQEHAPSLMAFLGQQRIEVKPGPADPEAAVKAREADMVLVVPGDYAKKWGRAEPVTLRLLHDATRDDLQGAVRRVERVVQTFGSQVGSMRLLVRGVSHSVATPLRLESVNVASAQKVAARVLTFIPMFVILAAFIGGMNIAIDATAGERERGSLEALLATPAPRTAIVLGKWCAAVLFAMLTMTLTLITCVAILGRIPLHEIGLSFSLGPAEILGVLAAALPMAPLAVALQMLVATFARSFKEAQTYMSLLMFLPMIPSLALSVYPVKTQAWMSIVPALGQQVLLSDVIGGEPPALGLLAISGVTSLLAGLLCLGATARLFQREAIIYGR